MQHGHLDDHAVGGFANHAAARSVENFVGDRDVAAHGQAMHEMAVSPRVLKPVFAHAPLAEWRACLRFDVGVTVVQR